MDSGGSGCAALVGGGVPVGTVDPVCIRDTGPALDPPIPGQVLEGSECGCSSVQGSSLALWIAVVAVLRRMGVLVALLAVPVLARAVDVDHLDPDGGRFAALPDGDVGEPGETRIALVATALRAPAVLVGGGGDPIEVVPLLTTADLAASVNLGPVHIAGLLPVHPLVVEAGQTTARWGDARLEVAFSLADRATRGRVGVAMDLATGRPGLLLGDGGAVEAVGAIDHAMGRLHLGSRLGLTMRQPEELPGVVWGNTIDYGAGLEWEPFEREAVAIEAFGSFGIQSGGAATLPMEALLSGRVGLDRTLDLRVGGGGGLGFGLGNPRWRLLVELDVHGRADRDQDGDRHPDVVDLCPRRPEDRDRWRDLDGCPDPDNDRDTILDPEDQCPDRPETWNAWADEDGCPDQLATVSIALAPGPEQAGIEIDGDPIGEVLGGEALEVVRPPGSWTIRATSDGWQPFDLVQDVPEGRSTLTLRLAPIPAGAVVPVVTGPDGQPVSASIALGPTRVDAATGTVRIPCPPGPVEIAVEASGYEPETVDVDAPADGDRVVPVRLRPLAVARIGQELVLGDRVRFGVDDSSVAPGDAAIDALAAWLLAHPEVRLLRIEGHADELGSSDYNLDLSTRRAEAVCAALVASGVAPERLQALGSGESLRAGVVASERLVEFLVLVWDD